MFAKKIMNFAVLLWMAAPFFVPPSYAGQIAEAGGQVNPKQPVPKGEWIFKGKMSSDFLEAKDGLTEGEEIQYAFAGVEDGKLKVDFTDTLIQDLQMKKESSNTVTLNLPLDEKNQAVLETRALLGLSEESLLITPVAGGVQVKRLNGEPDPSEKNEEPEIRNDVDSGTDREQEIKKHYLLLKRENLVPIEERDEDWGNQTRELKKKLTALGFYAMPEEQRVRLTREIDALLAEEQ